MLWQHIVSCKSTLLGMRLAMVCVVCYIVRDCSLMRLAMVGVEARRIPNNVLLHNTICCHNTLLI